jgi:hypothetical protein
MVQGKAHRDESLVGYAEDLIAYAREPTDATVERLGWRAERSTQAQDLMRRWRARRAAGSRP